MAFALKKSDLKRRDELAAALREKFQAVEDAVGAYNEALGEARDFVEDLASAAEDDFSSKSDKWQEGERGEAARSWIDALQEFAPEDIEAPEEEAAEALESLPERPE
jgi:hypothetical protein